MCVLCVQCVHACPRVWNETWQRRLECSLGTYESPTRRTRPSLPPSHRRRRRHHHVPAVATRSLPPASSPRYRKKRGPREVTATRKELAGIPWEETFSPLLHRRIFILVLSSLTFAYDAKRRFVRDFLPTVRSYLPL